MNNSEKINDLKENEWRWIKLNKDKDYECALLKKYRDRLWFVCVNDKVWHYPESCYEISGVINKPN